MNWQTTNQTKQNYLKILENVLNYFIDIEYFKIVHFVIDLVNFSKFDFRIEAKISEMWEEAERYVDAFYFFFS